MVFGNCVLHKAMWDKVSYEELPFAQVGNVVQLVSSHLKQLGSEVWGPFRLCLQWQHYGQFEDSLLACHQQSSVC